MKMFDDESNYKKLIHSKRWVSARNAKLKSCPVCERCHSALATCVHHIQPLNKYRTDLIRMEQLAFDPDNLMSLCEECHKTVHFELEKNKHKDNQGIAKERTASFMEKYFDDVYDDEKNDHKGRNGDHRQATQDQPE